MKLAFSGQARYPDYDDGYDLYVKRSRTNAYMSKESYKKVIRMYCKVLADRLYETGFIELPSGLGHVAVVTIDRKVKYFGDKRIGLGKMDWGKGRYDGSRKAFGITFLPRRRNKDNLRSYGFVANRRLFKKVKERSEDFTCNWKPLEFNDEMI